MVERLDEAARAGLAEALPEWTPAGGRDAIRRAFRFRDFGEAWGFMSRVALSPKRRTTTPSGRTSTTAWR
jgi:4a-hydroxytetrahydrobiopterin dehydratase